MEPEREPTVIESCHSTWVFDADRLRFRRIVKGAVVGGEPVATGWRPYYRLDTPAGSETFTVHLDLAGTRLLTSWRHGRDCTQCSEHTTGEMSLERLAAAIRS
jgi:hypothetical protein